VMQRLIISLVLVLHYPLIFLFIPIFVFVHFSSLLLFSIPVSVSRVDVSSGASSESPRIQYDLIACTKRIKALMISVLIVAITVKVREHKDEGREM
jgi:hypothetical protein